MNFAIWLSNKMDERRMTQSELADKLNLTRGAVNNLLAGRSKNPSPETMQKLSVIFRVPLEEVYRAAGNLPAESKMDARTRRILNKLENIEDEKDMEKIEGMIDLFVPDKRVRETRKNEKGNAHT